MYIVHYNFIIILDANHPLFDVWYWDSGGVVGLGLGGGVGGGVYGRVGGWGGWGAGWGGRS